MTLNRFSAALLSFVLILVGAVVAIPADGFDWKAGIQLAILGTTAGATLGLPLIHDARWQGILKTGVPVLLAILSGLTPLIVGGNYNHVTIGLIVLNALQVLASELGIQIRKYDDLTAPLGTLENAALPPAIYNFQTTPDADGPALAALSEDAARSSG